MTVPTVERSLRVIAERPRTASEVAEAVGADPDRLRKCLRWLSERGHLRYAHSVWGLRTRDVEAVVEEWRGRWAYLRHSRPGYVPPTR